MSKNQNDWSYLHPEIDQMLIEGMTNKTHIAKKLIERHYLDVNIESFRTSVRNYVNSKRDKSQYQTDAVETNKTVGDFDWKEWIDPVKKLQELAKKASSGQDYADWKIKTDKPICVVVIGDTQLGSWATNYDSFMKLTEEILNTPNLYVILVGDILQMAIKLRGVLEVMDNIIPPKFQIMFLDSWLNTIKHKVIAATWDNHSVMREENAVGYSSYAEIFKRHTIYFNHIGHLDIYINDICYKWAVTHFFQGKSLINRVHAPMRYIRHEAPLIDIAAQGDFHVPGIAKYWEGGKDRVAMVCGSIQTDSGYGKRFFSLTTCDTYPCVVLHPDKKMMTPFWSVKEWLATQSIQ